MRIFNEVGRWYSIPCKILTQVIYVKKKFKIHWKELELSSGHRPTDGRTDGQTDRQTDGRTGWIQYTPPKLRFGGYNDGVLLIEPLGTNFSETLIEIHIFSFKKMHLKMSSAKWRPFCLGLNVLSKNCPDSSVTYRHKVITLAWGHGEKIFNIFAYLYWIAILSARLFILLRRVNNSFGQVTNLPGPDKKSSGRVVNSCSIDVEWILSSGVYLKSDVGNGMDLH